MRPVLAAVVAVALLAAACSSGHDSTSGGASDSVAASTPAVSATALSPAASSSAADGTVGLVAVGHSGLTGYASGPAGGHADARENSWATGTNPAVDSVYERLLKAEPSIAGHVANTARDGATVYDLAGQLQAALAIVPRPQLVLIEVIDNDVKCDGTDDSNEVTFGQLLAADLNTIVTHSPATKILVLAQTGRPAEYFHATASIPQVVSSATGTGLCDIYDAAGTVRPNAVAALTSIVEGYEKQAGTVCAEVAQCEFTETPARYVDTLANLAAGDWNHLSVSGHAAFAALIWPTVAAALGLPH